MRRYPALPIALVLALMAGACAPAAPPVTVSREALGTVVSITAYGRDDASPQAAIATAFDEMARVEQQLDAYSATSAVAVFNRHPYVFQPLPAAGALVLDATARLGVTREFSSAMLGIVRLYDFEGTGRVPSSRDLATQVALSHGFETSLAPATESMLGRFVPLDTTTAPPPPGLDFGGAGKGLALAVAEAAIDRDVSAALLTAGSTTLTYGSKPDGEPWRIGIEDPREPGTVIATVEGTGALTVSTSGDYQRFFERDGVRYHHILDPATGLPVRGLRSLTVIGAASGLDSDILSTALFVMGPDRAADYCRAHALGMYVVDDEGRTHVVPAPSGADWRLVEQRQPKK